MMSTATSTTNTGDGGGRVAPSTVARFTVAFTVTITVTADSAAVTNP